MAIPYPSSPTVGQTFTYGGITYTWNGVAWVYTQTATPAVVGSVAVTAPITNSGTPTAPVIGINQSALILAQSQVTNLVSDLAGKANLAGGNTFTGTQIIGTNGTANKGLVVVGTASQSANLFEIQTSISTAVRVNSVGNTVFSGNISSNNNALFTPATTATVPLVVQGASGQSANLQEWQLSTGSTAIRVASNGLLSTSLSPAFAGLQSTSGAGAYFAMNNDTGGIVTYTNGSANKGLVVRGASGQTADALQIQDSGSNTYLNMSVFGGISSNLSGAYPGRWSVGAGVASTIPLVIRGASAQSAHLLQLQNSGGTVLAGYSATGRIYYGTGVLSNSGGQAAGLSVTSDAATVSPVIVRGAASQSANLQEWQDSSAGTPLSVSSTYGLVGRNAGTVSFALSSQNGLGAFYLQSASQVGMLVRGAASQTANLQEWQTSSGSTAAMVSSAGTFRIPIITDVGSTGSFMRMNGANMQIETRFASNIGLLITGAASQTADLQQWQSSSGTVAYMQAGGNFKANNIATFNSLWQATQNAGGALQIWARATAAASNPGANTASIYFRDGTTAGTLKFVSITGVSGVEETLIDNISSTSAVASARFIGAGGVNTAGSVISSAGLSLSGTTAPVLLNGSAGTSGQVLTSGGAGTTPTWTTVGGGGGSFTGGTLTSDLVLAAGSTAVEPLTFQANTSTVGTVSGAMEYDGTVFYQTSNTSPGKALATQNYYYVSSADYGPDFTVNSTAKSLLGGSTVGLTVAAGTTYEYELITAISHQYVTVTSISGDYLIVGTTVTGSPVVATTHQVDYGSNTTGFTTATTLSTVRPTGNVTFMPAITSGTRYAFLRAKGLIRVTGTGTVKIYPAMQTSGASGSGDNIWNVKAGTIFKLTPVGNGTVTQVGAFA